MCHARENLGSPSQDMPHVVFLHSLNYARGHAGVDEVKLSEILGLILSDVS